MNLRETLGREARHLGEAHPGIFAERVADLRGERLRLARHLAALFNPVLFSGVGDVLRITQQELAYLVGLSRQRVNEALKVLEARQLIRVEYGGLRILDLQGLRRGIKGRSALLARTYAPTGLRILAILLAGPAGAVDGRLVVDLSPAGLRNTIRPELALGAGIDGTGRGGDVVIFVCKHCDAESPSEECEECAGTGVVWDENLDAYAICACEGS